MYCTLIMNAQGGPYKVEGIERNGLQPSLCIAGSGCPPNDSSHIEHRSLRTEANFGKRRFIFQIDKFVASCVEQMQRRFHRTAKLLPPEILRMIAISLLDTSHDE